ncbi:MAG: hypothetical protein COV76_03385 [Candidatus Omnitrophica bacterium CG11_big_fil_rev_8_21_14_0_20_64_10]|nr:MAG: hypothetical protein COV76_03385 [Candidatus Omnitrophica bacterium CG11_big_fil_rev_8_21_14_0_20_64_10]
MKPAAGWRAAALGLAVGIGLGIPVPAQGAYDAKGKRDPLVPLVTDSGKRIRPPGLDEAEPGGPRPLALQGIVLDPAAGSYALINGEAIREGETGNGVRVIRIMADSVLVEWQGEQRRLELEGSAGS